MDPTKYAEEEDKSRTHIGLFHCLMFHVLRNDDEDKIKIGDMCHLGHLLGDEFISYYHDYLVLSCHIIAYDAQYRKETNIFDNYIELNSDDYRFLLMPPPDQELFKFKWDRNLMSNYVYGLKLKGKSSKPMDLYYNGLKFEKVCPKQAIHHLLRAYKSGIANAGYQISRIYSDSKDIKRRLQYLNELALNGYRKPHYDLACYF